MTPAQNIVDRFRRNWWLKGTRLLLVLVIFACSQSLHGTAKARTRSRASEPLGITQRRAFLESRLRDEEDRLEEQKRERETLARASTPSAQTTSVASSQSRDGLATEAIREQLATARERLTQLQITDTDLHPDVIAIRDQIAGLQQKLREANATSATAARVHSETAPDGHSGRKSTLAQIDASISVQGKEIADDKRQLEELNRASANAKLWKKPTQHTQDLSTSAPISQDQPPMIQPSPSSRIHTGKTIRAATGLIGLCLFFGLFIVLRKGHSKSIRDGAALQEMLPTEIDYIGSIPRMKVG